MAGDKSKGYKYLVPTKAVKTKLYEIEVTARAKWPWCVNCQILY